jgi:hypothetical protein
LEEILIFIIIDIDERAHLILEHNVSIGSIHLWAEAFPLQEVQYFF